MNKAQDNTKLQLVLHNIRSAHNVGSLFRTADGLGVDKLYLTGFTAYPTHPADTRLPHVSAKASSAIHKTALGAENNVAWEHIQSIEDTFSRLRADNASIIALEQAKNSISLHDAVLADNTAIVLGNEVDGLSPDIHKQCDTTVEIPMLGSKESFNVAVAGAIAIHWFRYKK